MVTKSCSSLFAAASVVALACAGAGGASGAEIRVLSAGAIEPGLVGLIASFERETGNKVKATFATAPAIRKRVAEGEAVDVLVAPPAVLDELSKGGKPAAGRAAVGRVGGGVAIRDGAPVPRIGSADELKQSMLEAEFLVYNQASTGIYVAGLIERLGIAGQVSARTRRYPDGAAVLDHLARGKGKEIGFGAIPEILAYSKRGVKLVGPLPLELQSYTSYSATAIATGSAADTAQAFVRYITAPAARAALAAAGVE
jgi:molybdate transport system substrate-binding protein